MRPGTLRLVKYSNMFNFAKPRFFQFNSFIRINFKNSIFNRILDFCQHIITVSVNHLYGFANLTT